jgi:hypothetical protein
MCLEFVFSSLSEAGGMVSHDWRQTSSVAFSDILEEEQ